MDYSQRILILLIAGIMTSVGVGCLTHSEPAGFLTFGILLVYLSNIKP